MFEGIKSVLRGKFQRTKRLDINAIAEISKEQLLEKKQYLPTFFVEFKDHSIGLVALSWLEESTERKVRQFFYAARKVARREQWKVKDITSVYFVVETWFNQQSPEENKILPSEDPNRREALVVMNLQLPSMKTTMRNIEMLRDGSGDLVDLYCHPEIMEAESNLLISFLGGIASIKFSDEQLKTLLQGGKL